MRARQIMVLVTGAALNRIDSAPIGSAPDLHRVLMAVVSLARKISGGVTIHAARMAHYRNDGLKSSSRTIARCSVLRRVLHCGEFCTFGLRSGIECQQEGG
jgi:hypothetical protein